MRIRRGNSFAMLNLYVKKPIPLSFRRTRELAICLVYALFVHNTCKESKYYREAKIAYFNTS